MPSNDEFGHLLLCGLVTLASVVPGVLKHSPKLGLCMHRGLHVSGSNLSYASFKLSRT